MKLRFAVSKVVSAVIISVIITGIVVGFGTYFGARSRISSPTLTTTITSPITKTLGLTTTKTVTVTSTIPVTPSTTTSMPSPTITTTTTTTTSTTTTPPTTTTSNLAVLTIGTSKIRVPKDFYNFVMKVKAGEIKVSINFWTAMLPFEVKGMQKVVNDFMKEFPGVIVKYTGTVSNMKEAVKAGVVAGDVQHTADVFTWAHDWTGELAEGGYILPIDKYFPPQTIEDLQSQYLSTAFAAGMYKLHYYGFPWAAEAIALVCNNKLVPNPPQTFDQMKAIMEKYYNPSNNTYGIVYQLDPYFIYPFVTAFGGYYFNQLNNSVGANSTGTVEGIKFLLQNVVKYEFSGSFDHETQLKIFLNRQAPFIITGPWDIPAIKESVPNITVTAIPKIDGKTPRPFSGIKLLWITSLAAKDKNKLYASFLFTMWFSLNDNDLKYLIKESGFIPVKKTIVQYLYSNEKNFPIIAGFIKSIVNSIPMPNSPKMAYVWGPVTDGLNAILTKYSKSGLQAALQAVQPTLNKAQADILKSFSGG